MMETINTIQDFLKNNPSETIFIRITCEVHNVGLSTDYLGCRDPINNILIENFFLFY
jgi:hypothetical protein